MPASAEIQQATLDRFIAGWSGWHAPEMIALLTDDCTQRELPFSLDAPTRTRAEIDKVLPKLSQLVTNFELKVHEIVHDAPKGKAVIYALSTGNTPVGDWKYEHSMFITFDESGHLIAKIEEMVDSAFMKEFNPKFKKCLQGEVPVNGAQ